MKPLRQTVCLGVLSVLLFAAMIPAPSSAYFWDDDPTDWGHDDEPPDNSTDGVGIAKFYTS